MDFAQVIDIYSTDKSHQDTFSGQDSRVDGVREFTCMSGSAIGRETGKSIKISFREIFPTSPPPLILNDNR